MRIVFIGDIYGRAGREALQKHLPEIQAAYRPDVTIVNGENAVHGAGIDPKTCTMIYGCGADVITTGNHIWDKREIIPYIARDHNLLRPMNYPPGTPGNGSVRFKTEAAGSVLVVNLMGRLFMDALDDPFQAMSKLLEKEALGRTAQAIFVDFHAETTSEKMAFAHYFDGRISAVIGTHTHVPTADAHVMERGTGFMADAGMTGDYDSVIGARKDISYTRFVRKMPGERLSPARGRGTLCGVFIITDEKTGLAKHIEPIRRGPLLTETPLPV